MTTFVKVDDEHQLEAGAAGSFKRMQRDGMPADRLESAKRLRATQQRLYDLYKAGKGNFALPPDKSNHVKGIAIDSHGAQQRWIDRNGARYGWIQDANEPWHFDYVPAKDQVLAAQKRAAAAAKKAAARGKVKKIQKVLGVTTDGDPGPKTKAAWDKLVKEAQ